MYMRLFKKHRNQFLDEFDEERELYAAAAKEFDDGTSHLELRAKVIEEACASMEFARTLFIEERMRMMSEENLRLSEISVRNLRVIKHPSPHQPLASVREKSKRVSSYVTLLIGFILMVVALLYLSLGGTRTGLYLMTSGVFVLLLGVFLLKFSRQSIVSTATKPNRISANSL